MRKIYAFLTAALFSVSMFASLSEVPSDQVIMDAAGAEAGQVVVCIYVDGAMACNDIVFVGTYYKNDKGDWLTSPIADLAHFEAIEGYDGWYVVAVDDATDSPEGKPVMLDGDGNFNWAYQVGAANVLRGDVTVVAGLPGEIDLKTYGKTAPNVYVVESWKQNPCTAVYHNYTLTVISDGCDGYVVPFLVGGMNNWNAQEMQIDQAKTMELGVPTYYLTFKAAEETEYQLLSGLRDPQTGLIDSTAQPGWNDDSYLQVYTVDSTGVGSWSRYNPGNSKTGADPEILYDVRVDTLRWARCDGLPTFEVAVYMKAPAGAPDTVQIIGSFDGWKGQNMTWNPSTDYFEATVQAKETMVFKFRQAGTWDNQIEYYDATNDEWLTFGDGHEDLVFGELWGDADAKQIVLDFSDAALYRWQAGAEGIENVVLTEQAQKVIVDGVLYIVRDNKMFNVQGTQVR